MKNVRTEFEKEANRTGMSIAKADGNYLHERAKIGWAWWQKSWATAAIADGKSTKLAASYLKHLLEHGLISIEVIGSVKIELPESGEAPNGE